MNGDPLAELRDIRLPADPGWWPPAPGWWVLALVCLILLAAGALWLVRRHRRLAPQRAFRRAVQDILADPGLDERARLHSLSRVTRRYAISVYGRERVASLSGEQWLSFLDQAMEPPGAFSQGRGRILGEDLYRPGAVDGVAELGQLLLDWSRRIRRHA